MKSTSLLFLLCSIFATSCSFSAKSNTTQTAIVAVTATTAPASTSIPTIIPAASPTVTQMPSATFVVPEGYKAESDKDLHLSFVHPSTWDVDKGTRTLPKSGVEFQFISFSQVRSDEYKIVNITSLEQPMQESPAELLDTVLNINDTKLKQAGADIIEGVREITVDNQLEPL